MASSANRKQEGPQKPASYEILRPSTWRNRGNLAGPGSPDARYVSGRAPSLLAIHGFGGTPRDVDLLVDIAAQMGLGATAPLLLGHGTHVKDLISTRYEDWVNAARVEFERLRAQGEVIVAGLSLGAVIAARLASESRPAGLVLLANAFWLNSPYPARYLAIAERLHLPSHWWVPKLAPDIDDPVRRQEHLGYDAQLISAAIEVYRAGRDNRIRIGAITCPTLVIHGQLDKVCPVGNAQRVVDALGTKDARCVILPNSGHILTRDRERELVSRECKAFLARLVGESTLP